ncbi:transposase [Isosphaeraceae bacterium EP7]
MYRLLASTSSHTTGTKRYLISDELWHAMEPLVARAKRHRGGQSPVIPDRLFFKALLYWGRTGIPWRDLPAEFGAWDAVSIASGDGSPRAPCGGSSSR